MNQEHLINICREGLIHGLHGDLQYLEQWFIDVLNHSILHNSISNVYVSFMFCLSLKKYLQSAHSFSFALKSQLKEANHFNMDSQKMVIKLAKSSNFYQNLFQSSSKSLIINPKNRSYDNENRNLINFIDDNQFKQFQYQPFSIQWHQNLLFFQFLIQSLTNQDNKNQNQVELNFAKGLKQLRYQLFAKLMIPIFYELLNSNEGSQSIFDIFFQELRPNQSQIQVIISDISILGQLIEELKTCDTIYAKNINTSYGSSIREYVYKGLDIVLQKYPTQVIILHQYFDVVNNYLEFICKINQHFISTLDTLYDTQDNHEDLIKIFQGKINFDPQIKIFNQNICTIIIEFINGLNSTNMQVIRPILQILQKLTCHCSYEDLFDCQENNYEDLNVQKLMMDIVKEIMTKFLDYKNSLSQNRTYNNIQSIFIDIFQNIIAFDESILKSNRQFMHLILTQFCSNIINKTQIKVQQGRKSTIPKIFTFLTQILELNIVIISQSFMQSKMKQLITSFLKRCLQADDPETDFIDYQQKRDSYHQYFQQPLHFINKLYQSQQTKECIQLFTYLKSLLFEQFNSKSNNIRKYITILSIQMMRNIQSNNQSIITHQKCQLFLYLIQQFNQSFIFQYLMLIDAIIQQIIKEQSYLNDPNSSYLWWYLNHNICTSFQTFISTLMQNLINCLQNAHSSTIVNYSLDLVIQLTTKIKTIVDHSSSNINNGANDKTKAIQMQVCLAPLCNLMKQTNLQQLSNIENYHQRCKIFQLYGLLNIKKIEDLYIIHDIIRQSLYWSEKNYIFYWIDVKGVLSVDFGEQIDQVLLELIFDDLRDNIGLLQCFTSKVLVQCQIYFSIFIDILKSIIKKLIKMDNIDIKKELQYRFVILFEVYLNNFGVEYNKENYQTIHEIYELLTHLKALNNFPKLPQIFYTTKSSQQIVNWLLQNMSLLSSDDQLKKLYNNIFMRKYLAFQDGIQQKLKEQIIITVQHPNCLMYFMDYFEDITQKPFFNYKIMVDEIVRYLYEIYCGKDQLGVTMDPYDFQSYDSEEQQVSNKIYVQKFFKENAYKKKINILAKIIYYWEQKTNSYEFKDFEKLFIDEQKTRLQCL